MPLTNSQSVWVPLLGGGILCFFIGLIVAVNSNKYNWLKASLVVSIYSIIVILTSVGHKMNRGYFMYPDKAAFIASPLKYTNYLWDVTYNDFNPDIAINLVRVMAADSQFKKDNPKLYERYAVPYYTDLVSKEYNKQVSDKVTELVNNPN